MRRIRLTATEQAHLDQLCKTTNDRRLRDRCQAIGLAHRGRQRQTIAPELGGHRPTVRLWLQQYDAPGVEGLPSPWGPRQRGRMPETLVLTRHEGVQAGPQGCGRERAHWTDAALATSRDQSTGLAVPRTARRGGCRRSALRPSRPPSRSRRGDPEQPPAARAERTAGKKSPRGTGRVVEPR